MASDKLLEIQKKTSTRLEKQASLQRHQELVSQLEGIAKNNTTMVQALVGFLSGHTTKTEVINQLKSVSTPDVEKVVKAVEKLEKSMAGKAIDWSPILPLLVSLEQHMAAVPKELPEAPEKVEVDFTGTNERLDSIEQAVKGLKLVVEAPKVDIKVPQAKVIVEQTDLTEIKTPLLDILEAFRAFQIPEPISTDLTTVEDLLRAANELLKKIEKKSGGGGGGGGGAFAYKDPATGFSAQANVNTDGSVATASKPTEKYGYSAKSVTATYKYYFFEDKDGLWYILRKTIATDLVQYATGTGGVASVFVSNTSDPAGSLTFASYAVTFN